MASTPTLSSPPLRPEPPNDDDMVQHNATSRSLSPPLSQECQSHLSLMDLESAPDTNHHQQQQEQQQQQQHSQQPVHPLDSTSPTGPKKMLNWVNALPAHFDTASSGHPRKRRRRTNREELEILEEAFAKNLLPDATTRQELGERLGMSVRAVQIWFQNKRQTLRKKSISSSGGHPLGSDDDMMFRSDDGESSRHSPRRRSSGDSAASSSPPRSSPTCESGVARRTLTRGSRSCSSLLSSSPPSLASQRDSQTLLRAETCSSLPTTVSSLSSSLEMSSLRSPTPTKSATDMKTVVTETREPSPHAEEVIVKTEVIESSPRDILVAVAESVKDIVDVKTADMHLCMLLEEAKRRSGQAVKPVMGLWSETSNKPALNAPVSGTFPRTTATFPTPKRTMSMPCTNLQQNARSHPKPSRKHRSMPDPTTLSTLHHSCMPYSRTQSLMEQVINRQQQHHHHHHHYRRPTPSNFKQSALSASKHSLDSIAHKALKASPRIAASTELSPTALARPSQHTVSSNLKRVQSESVLHERGARTGQTAMRARRLSFGKFLFDTDEDTDEEIPFCNKKVSIPSPPTTPADVQSMQRRTSSQQELTHQAQKRRAGTPATPTRTPGRAQLVDGDETDEEDFVALNKRSAFKRLNLAKDFSSPTATCSFVPLQHSLQGGSRKHDWTKTHKLSPRTSLKPSLSTLSLVRSSPTRQYAFEMERSRSPLTSYPILERNRAWNGSLSPNSESTQHHLHHHHASAPTTSGSTVTPEILNAPAMEETKDLNMDELECASVLAGLGWGH